MNSKSICVLLACAILAASCSGSGGNTPTSPMMSGTLMDSPFRTSGGTVTAVNIAIEKFEVVGQNGIQTVATFSPSLQVNLLDYQTSGLSLGNGQIPPGTYSQIRLVLDTSSPNNTSIVLNGQTIPLSIP